MSYKVIQQKRQKLAEKVKEADAILAKASKDGDRELTGDEHKKFESIHKDIESLSAHIGALEKQQDAKTSISDVEAVGDSPPSEKDELDPHLRGRAFAAFAMGPKHAGSLPEDVKAAMDVMGFDLQSDEFGLEPGKGQKADGPGYRLLRNDDFNAMRHRFALNQSLISRALGAELGVVVPTEKRAAMGTAAGVGGDMIPEGFVPRVEASLLAFGGMLQVAEILRTDSGNDLPWPSSDDTGNMGALLAESTAVNEQNITTGKTTYEAFKYESKLVLVPTELIEDSAINIENFVASRLGERIGRILNNHFTVGTGSSQPRGITVAATTGKTAASATVITPDEVLELKHAVDPAYRQLGARFMWNDSTLLHLKLKKDGQGRYLWKAGLADGTPNSYDGDPYTINQDMPSIATTTRPIVYGALSKYKVRMVRGMRVLVLRERYAEKDQVGFVNFIRADGDLNNTAAVQRLVMA